MRDFKKDYYAILNIPSSASTDEVKFAYRKQVKKYHPDLHPDNAEFAELIKEINEAYEVLSDKDERFAYDLYFENKIKEKEKRTARDNHKRTYTKTTTVYAEERTYVKGTIFIKYFGKQNEQNADHILRQTDYHITVTQTEAIIEEIVKIKPNAEFVAAFNQHKPIRLAIHQPINCTIRLDDNLTNYKLDILDLTIPNPEIIHVTKHEGDTFGTITGTFFGYVKELKSHIAEVQVEECYGETGKTDEKFENGICYRRKEYYHADCTTFWGNWISETKFTYHAPNSGKAKWGSSGTSAFKANGQSKKWGTTNNTFSSNTGCLGTFGKILSFGIGCLLLLLLFPGLGFLVPLILIPFILSLVPAKFLNWIGGIILMFFSVLFLLAIYNTIQTRHIKKNEQTTIKKKTRLRKAKYTPIADHSSTNKKRDTLISHHLEWDDYNGKTYTGDFSMLKSEYNQSHLFKDNLPVSADSENSYNQVIFSLKENDGSKLNRLYFMFDSIRLANRPNAMKFAEIIVSSIQTIPYTIVLPKACDTSAYQDEFTVNYLLSKDARCDGFQRYGINTPVEFVTTLNGDCDTRTLLLYTILSHYQYDVALLSSSHYGHSMLGINLPYDGQAFLVNDQRYVFWETTANIKPGMLSNEMADLNYWHISLKSK